ncbi:retrovirus-related pol polyprotein from transposon tnt 1-94, partial [Plasmopara halstedii]
MTLVAREKANTVKSTTVNKDMSYMWHLRLGHIGHDGLSAIIKKNLATGIDIASVNKWEIWDGCALGKQTRVQFQSRSTDRASKLLEVIHSVVCGSMKPSTFSGKRYFVTFIDDNSRYCVVYLIKNKSEVVDKIADFVAFADKQTSKRVKSLRSDNGDEYTSATMAKFCLYKGIVLKYTRPYTPQLNGVAERMNRTLVECARCMLEHAGLSKHYWGEAVMTAMFLQNRLKVFGCHAFVHIPKEKRSKVDAKAVLCRFSGYSEHQKTYRLEERSTGKIIMSRAAQFKEGTFDDENKSYNKIVTSQDDDKDDDEEILTDNDMDSEAEQTDDQNIDTNFELGSKRHT